MGCANPSGLHPNATEWGGISGALVCGCTLVMIGWPDCKTVHIMLSVTTSRQALPLHGDFPFLYFRTFVVLYSLLGHGISALLPGWLHRYPTAFRVISLLRNLFALN